MCAWLCPPALDARPLPTFQKDTACPALTSLRGAMRASSHTRLRTSSLGGEGFSHDFTCHLHADTSHLHISNEELSPKC